MALEINTQYTKFVQFAEAEMHKGERRGDRSRRRRPARRAHHHGLRHGLSSRHVQMVSLARRQEG